jgi:hypothetical protein
MRLFNKLRLKKHEASLRLQLDANKIVLAKMAPNDGHAVAILFDASQLDDRRKVIEYAELLKRRGKRVHLLGFIDNKQKEGSYNFKFFNRLNLNWCDVPSGFEVQRFLDETYDLLIYLDPNENISLSYLARLAKARFKVGTTARSDEHFDLTVNAKTTDLSNWIRHVDATLKRIEIPSRKQEKIPTTALPLLASVK